MKNKVKKMRSIKHRRRKGKENCRGKGRSYTSRGKEATSDEGKDKRKGKKTAEKGKKTQRKEDVRVGKEKEACQRKGKEARRDEEGRLGIIVRAAGKEKVEWRM